MEFKKEVKNKKKYLAINIALYAILFLSISFNKEYIRPIYGNSPVLGILTGSFSNFMAAYIISLFAISAIILRKLEVKKARLIFYSVAIGVFILLAIEEIAPYVNASKTYDIFDIIASGLGSFFAIITFELFTVKRLNNKQD